MKQHHAHLTGFHHIAIICSNYDVSKNFYHKLLGFEIINETFREQRSSWKLDLAIPNGGMIELFSFANAPLRPNYPEAQGLRHLAFGTSDIESSVRYLQTHDIECEAIRLDSLTQKRFTFFKDPDNLPIELYEVTLDV